MHGELMSLLIISDEVRACWLANETLKNECNKNN
jgi:hypothetical protein